MKTAVVFRRPGGRHCSTAPRLGTTGQRCWGARLLSPGKVVCFLSHHRGHVLEVGVFSDEVHFWKLRIDEVELHGS